MHPAACHKRERRHNPGELHNPAAGAGIHPEAGNHHPAAVAGNHPGAGNPEAAGNRLAAAAGRNHMGSDRGAVPGALVTSRHF
ncbi:hypothetical protein HerbRD11066_33870 [Herbidospora sp. RD11066]